MIALLRYMMPIVLSQGGSQNIRSLHLVASLYSAFHERN
jgi:hypothetical protein